MRYLIASARPFESLSLFVVAAPSRLTPLPLPSLSPAHSPLSYPAGELDGGREIFLRPTFSLSFSQQMILPKRRRSFVRRPLPPPSQQKGQRRSICAYGTVLRVEEEKEGVRLE